MKKTNDADAMDKLMKLTKMIKKDEVKVEPKGSLSTPNKWRNKDPKFTPKPPKPDNLVEAGGMQVDPTLKEEYDRWREDKIAEQNERRAMAAKRAAAKKKAREDSSTGTEQA